MSWLGQNLIETFLIIGILLLIIEIAVLGFSTFFLFFTGLAAIVTSILMWLGVLPETFVYSLVSVSVLTTVFAVVLWKPMSNMQKHVDTTRAKSDLIGHSFILPQAIIASAMPDQKPQYQFSGILWRLESATDIAQGTRVQVSQVDVGVLWVVVK